MSIGFANWKITLECSCGETSSESGIMCLPVLLKRLAEQVEEEIGESQGKHTPKKIVIQREGA